MKRIIAALFFALMSQAVVPPANAELVVGRVCCTNAGSCELPQWRLLGSYCTCTGLYGTDPGRVCR